MLFCSKDEEYIFIEGFQKFVRSTISFKWFNEPSIRFFDVITYFSSNFFMEFISIDGVALFGQVEKYLRKNWNIKTENPSIL